MIQIPLSLSPANIVTDSTVLYNGWSSVPYPVEIEHRAGDEIPGEFNVEVRVKDIFNTPLDDINALSYRVSANVINVFPSTNYNWCTTSFEAGITENNTIVSVPLAINILPAMASGNTFEKDLNLVLIKELPGNISQVLSSFKIRVILKYVGATEVNVVPGNLIFNHIVGFPAPATKSISVSAPSNKEWILAGSSLAPGVKSLTLTSDSPNVEIGIVPEDSDIAPPGAPIAFGTGPAVLDVGLGEDYLSSSAPGTTDDGLILRATYPFAGQQTEPVLIKTYPVRVNRFNEAVLYCDTASLQFSAVRYINEAEPSTILIYSTLPDLSYQLPPWLIAEELLYENNILYLKITPLSPENIGIGNYFGNIIISNSGSALVVPVVYLVSETLGSFYELEGINYTLDEKFIEVFSNNENSYIDTEMTVKVYDFYSLNHAVFTERFMIPLFKGFGKMNIGRIVHRFLNTGNKFLSGSQYKPMEVGLIGYEKDYVTKEVLSDFSSPVVKFVAGRTPYTTVEGLAFLENENYIKRITPSGFDILNIIHPPDKYTSLTVYRNGENISFEQPIFTGLQTALQPVSLAFSEIESKLVDFSNFEIREGDFIEVRIGLFSKLSNNNNQVIQKYVCFPKTDFSYFLVYEDIYKLKKVFEFTGKYRIESEITNETEYNLKDLVSVLRKLSSNKISKVFFDTGWIPENNQVIIEQIKMSPKVWLKKSIDEDYICQLVPVSTKITNKDVDRFLISYTVEFEIIPIYNEKNYTF